MKVDVICLKKNDRNHNMILLGDIHLKTKRLKNQSRCHQNNNNFDYHQIELALCGNCGLNYLNPIRIVVIQMK